MSVTGISPETIIDVATRRAKVRGNTDLDLTNELLIVIQDLCGLAKWEWRKRVADVPLASNTQIYDLSDATAVAPGFDMSNLETIETVQLIDENLDVSTLVKVVDHHEQGQVLVNTEQGKPKKYFAHPNHIYSLVIYPRADNVYSTANLKIVYWAIPPGPLDPNGTLSAVVPVVPAYLHRSLIKGLEAQILRYTLGEANASYIAAQTEYTAQVKALMPTAV